MIKKFLSFSVTALILTACSVNPVTGKQELVMISEKAEINLGSEAFLSMIEQEGGKALKYPDLENYVQSVGKKLVSVSDRPNLPFEFVILENPVPNAWTLPGGKIAINTGLLVQLHSEAELAAVLSHEIVHAAARHSAKQMEKEVIFDICAATCSNAAGNPEYAEDLLKVGSTLAILKYSRDHELEADKYGMKYMSKAGYDVQAAVNLQEMFLRISEKNEGGWIGGLLNTHPPSKERLKANQKTAAKYPAGGFVGEEEYQMHIAPLTL